MNNYETLFEHFAHNLRRPDIDQRIRAELIQENMDLNHISQREFARRFGLKHSTVQDWLRISKLSVVDEKALLTSGLTKTDLYKALRLSTTNELKEMNELDFRITTLTDMLSRTQTVRQVSKVTADKIDFLKKAISTFEFRLGKEK
jgi:transcriptional regulator with XRE-family HTH domain